MVMAADPPPRYVVDTSTFIFGTTIPPIATVNITRQSSCMWPMKAKTRNGAGKMPESNSQRRCEHPPAGDPWILGEWLESKGTRKHRCCDLGSML